MIPVVVLQPSSSFPSGHDQGGGEVVVANLFTMDLMLVVIVRRWWEGWSRSIYQAEMFVRDVCDDDFTSSPSFISLAATATTSVPSL